MEVFTRDYIMPDKKRITMRDIFVALENIATDHVDSLNLGREYFDPRGLAWVLTSQNILATKTPLPGQKVQISTWPGSTKFALYPRYFLMCDEEGNELLRSGSLWTIMDLNERKIVYPENTGISIVGIETGNETPLAKTIPSVKSEPETFFTVTDDDIDKNGHMNNTVYLDWLEKVIGEEFFENNHISQLTITYKRELLLGDRANIAIRREEGGITIQGIHDDTAAFIVRARFGL